MTRRPHKLALTALTLTGLLTSVLLSSTTQAATPKQSPHRPNVVIDQLGPGLSDAAMGFKTHWECELDLSVPTSPFTCWRIKDAKPTSTVIVQHAVPSQRPAYTLAGFTHRSTSDLPNGPCNQNLGIKIWQDQGYAGSCVRFTGTGDQDLNAISYPNTGVQIGFTMSSLSTLGSNGHGYITCFAASDFSIQSNSSYYGVGQCNDNGNRLFSK